VSCAETAEPIDLPFGLWATMGRRKHKCNCICPVVPMCPHGRAHWRHLVNTIEPSVAAMRSYLKLLWPLVSIIVIIVIIIVIIIIDYY